MRSPPGPGSAGTDHEIVAEAETALKALGYHRSRSAERPAEPSDPTFWVVYRQSRRPTIPVYVAGAAWAPTGAPWTRPSPPEEADAPTPILVVPTDAAAESAWGEVPRATDRGASPRLRILVLRNAEGTGPSPHWHQVRIPPRDVLRLATGLVVGMYRRAFANVGSGDVDFGELLRSLRDDYHVDVHASLGVSSDEDALFVLYHLALRDTFAPGSIAANLHSVVANPTGPASRVPWFAG